MYLGELAPKNLRGGLGVVPQLFITIGILVAQIFGLRSLLANEEGKLKTPLDHSPLSAWTFLWAALSSPVVSRQVSLPHCPGPMVLVWYLHRTGPEQGGGAHVANIF